MPKVTTRQISDILHNLPEILPFGITNTDRQEDDLFLCALGFEPRCLTIPRILSQTTYRARLARYFQYSTNADDNEANRPELEKNLRAISTSVEPIPCDEQDFSLSLSKFFDTVEMSNKCHRPAVTLDMSVASNRLLLKCMGVLLRRNITLRLLYSEAGTYHPSKDEFELNAERWMTDDSFGLEHGVAEVVPSKEQPGHHLDPLPNCIVLFPTFKAARARATIAAIDPSLLASPKKGVYWMLGEPHLTKDLWRLAAMAKINGVTPDLPQFKSKTFDYKDTLRLLETIHTQMWEQHNISIAQFGSKLQTLGTSIFCYLHPEVRLWYAIPKKYNAAQYSDGCKATWMIEFGPMQQVREVLNSVGKLVLEN